MNIQILVLNSLYQSNDSFLNPYQIHGVFYEINIFFNPTKLSYNCIKSINIENNPKLWTFIINLVNLIIFGKYVHIKTVFLI